ncbi:MAG: PIN domain-containing protein [Candidatus Gracilibacteria bacterium]
MILDSSVWIALVRDEDSQHEKCEALIDLWDKEDLELYDFTFAETLNVLKRKTSPRTCYNFLKFLERINLNVRVSTLAQLELANELFFNNFKNNLSFTDYLLIASAKLQKAEILTFDKRLEDFWKNGTISPDGSRNFE